MRPGSSKANLHEPAVGASFSVRQLRGPPVELEIVPDSRESHPNGSVLIRRRNLIGAGALLLALVWLAGTNNLGLLIGLGVLLAGSAVFLWRKNRVDMRSVLGDLRPPAKP